MTEIIAGVAALADRYDGFLVDLWGVLHDGSSAYPGAPDCLRELQSRGKTVVILSNAARRQRDIAAELTRFDITADCFEHIVSSGELTHRALLKREEPWHARLRTRCYFLGPQRSRGIVAELPVQMVTGLEHADFIVNAGAEGNPPDTSPFRGLLARAAARRLPMVCANPDLIAVRGGVPGICAGALAADYESLGGDVYYHGKPHAPIYDVCLSLLDRVPRTRILAVGDALRTDVAGAKRAGIDALFVAAGIHAPDCLAADGSWRMDGLEFPAGIEPDFAVRTFSW